MVPKGWSQTTFNAITLIGNGQVDPKIEPYASMVHIGPDNVVSNTGQLANLKSCSELGLISGKYEFDQEAIVYSKIRPNLNKVCKPNFKGVCSADMYPIWAKENLDIDFLLHYMLGPAFYKIAVSMSMRTGMPKINRSDLNAVPVWLPPLPEQKKIAQILSTWDQAITTTERLVANSQQQKKALMQQLLTGKKRLHDNNGQPFAGEWQNCKIGKLLSESRISSNNNDPDNRLTVRLNLKGIEKREFRGTESTDATAHFIRKTGQFIYGKQNIHKGSFGIIPQEFDGFETSQDLPAFNFTGECDSVWFFHFVSQEWFYKSLENKMSGTGSKRLSPIEFFKVKVLLPSKEEQQKIAAVLSSADKEVNTLKQKLDLLKLEKKSLMQQLLTGKRRVVI